jgi:hypothetical protein
LQAIVHVPLQLAASQLHAHIVVPFTGIAHRLVHEPHLSTDVTNASHAGSYGRMLAPCRFPLLS